MAEWWWRLSPSRLAFGSTSRRHTESLLACFSFRASWWQWDLTLAGRVKRAQRKMLLDAMSYFKSDLESWDEFTNRKSRQCSALQAKFGFWRFELAARSLRWGEHVSRNHCNSWPGRLVKEKTGKWLRSRRILMQSVSVFGGATGSRPSPGRPSTRLEDGQRFCAHELGLPMPEC